LDAAWAESCDEFIGATAPLPEEWRGLVASLFPARQVIGHFAMNSDYFIHKEASTSTTLQITPTTLAYERRFARAASHRQSIHFEVVAHPFLKEKNNG
jgi:hypothetical protein